MISEQGLHTQASSASPNNKDTSTQFSTGFSFRECAHGISRRQTQTPRSLDRGVHGFLTTNTGFLFCVGITPGSLADWLPFIPLRTVGSNGSEPPLTAYFVCFICMHQGRHLSPWELHAFHPYAFLPPLGKSRVLPKDLG
jgi:hypothetical protein